MVTHNKRKENDADRCFHNIFQIFFLCWSVINFVRYLVKLKPLNLFTKRFILDIWQGSESILKARKDFQRLCKLWVFYQRSFTFTYTQFLSKSFPALYQFTKTKFKSFPYSFWLREIAFYSGKYLQKHHQSCYTGQRNIQRRVKQLRGSFLRKIFGKSAIFCKRLHLSCLAGFWICFCSVPSGIFFMKFMVRISNHSKSFKKKSCSKTL